ncbi:PREDICTED: uncharacterized protein C16orf95 homolog isoform X2 [Chinchilla lanigera]|uniref:uncharacterized protein C16orf95 homolog isoform X2 n=1 Tax=Chinchilla lanigera TaxID=34839 RepID=UPI00038E99E0|nr:PREDICTED: uncharacterized protein C16orf95 homolog isoform X2 [Chinchilla lanigera]
MTRDDPSAGSPGAACAAAAEPAGARESTLQTFRKEVCFTDRPCSNLLPKLGRSQEHICCKCRARFRGHLPVPKAEAALPYWVPLSLRPQKQAPKMVQPRVSTPAKACLCPCHRFGGLLPVPRDQAVMPYWVPRGLRSQKKAPPGLTLPAQPPADLRWGQLLKGQLLALPQDELRAPGRAAPQPQHCEPPPKCRHGRSPGISSLTLPFAPTCKNISRNVRRGQDPQ